VVFPIHHHGQVVGSSPAATRPRRRRRPEIPQHPNTVVFHKGDCLFGLSEAADALRAGATPVRVEGPLDAIAVTLAAGGDHIGLAPLGTALTDAQADQLRRCVGPGTPATIVATDADPAGRAAAIHDYWQLVLRGDTPATSTSPTGSTPPNSCTPPARRRYAPRSATNTRPLVHTVIEERIARYAHRLDSAEGIVFATRAAAQAIAPLPPNSGRSTSPTSSVALTPRPAAPNLRSSTRRKPGPKTRTASSAAASANASQTPQPADTTPADQASPATLRPHHRRQHRPSGGATSPTAPTCASPATRTGRRWPPPSSVQTPPIQRHRQPPPARRATPTPRPPPRPHPAPPARHRSRSRPHPLPLATRTRDADSATARAAGRGQPDPVSRQHNRQVPPTARAAP